MATAIPYIMAGAAVVSAGSSVYSTRKGIDAADKARKEQRAALAKAEKEAEAEKSRIENLENERLERLRRQGARLPPSLITGMSGLAGAPSTLKPTLG